MLLVLREKIGVFDGKRVAEITIEDSASVLELRHAVSETLKIRVNNLIVFLDGEFLDAGVLLSEYGITAESKLTFEVKMCGPVPINRDWGTVGYKKRLTVGAGAATNNSSNAPVPL
jgi:hypothetical protein